MQLSPRQFPHPVLSYFSDDLIGCDYQMAVIIATTGSTYQFDVVARSSSADLNELLETGRASHAIHVDCSRTRYRNLFTWNTERNFFHLDSKLLIGKVQISRFIIAEDDIPEYVNSNFNPDFSDLRFNIKKGDILALQPTITFDADKEIDPLKNVPSIFRIKVSKMDEAPPMDIDLQSNKINVYLSESNYQYFKHLQLNQGLQPVLCQLVITPALVCVLEQMMRKDNDEDFIFDELRWYKVLSKKLRDLGIDPDTDSWPKSTVDLAQKLVSGPLTKSLEAISIMEDNS